MVILGLTGSIGMGKSTAAKILKRMGAAVCDSDAVVHRLMGRGGRAVPRIAEAFPDAVRDGVIDRRRLGAAVFGNARALARLEAILHPMVVEEQVRYLRQAARRRVTVAVLDIPLLFETGSDARVDRTIVVTAPARIQRARVLARRGMTEETFARILARQMPDIEKRRRADFVVRTGLSKGATRRTLTRIYRTVKTLAGRHWPPKVQALERFVDA